MRRFQPLLCLALALSAPAFANRVLDDRYAFKLVVPLVLNDDKQPIYGREVEKEMGRILRESGRFEVSDEGFLYARRELDQLKDRPVRFGKPTVDSIRFLEPILENLKTSGVDSVIISDVQEISDHDAQVTVSLVNAADMFIVHSSTAIVADKKALNNYLVSTRVAMGDLMEHLPFDANIVVRDGYRVVLDQGQRKFRKGMRVSAFTIEASEEQLRFEETGTILITNAEDKLAFGKVMVEKRPYEVGQANKIRVTTIDFVATPGPAAGRGLASEATATVLTLPDDNGHRKPQYGYVEANLTPTTVGVTHTLANGGGTLSGRSLFMMALALRGELYLTNSLFFEMGMRIGRGPMSPLFQGNEAPSVSAGLTDIRALVGYRYSLEEIARGLVVFVKGGVKTQSLSFSDATSTLFLTDNSFAGFLVGGGASMPITKDNGIEIELNTLLLRSFGEGPLVSGAEVNSVASWEMSARFYHHINREWDVTARLLWAGNQATFSGRGQRRANISQIDHSLFGGFVGLAYFF